ncbi:MAG TPA: hypothetical protein PLS45_10505, partial [Bacillota bacterium]|nr:hypothetical protein [Bacillota bacterium]
MNHRVLQRKRVNEQLNNIFKYPLTVAVAAMGYGKTTAVREFLDREKARYVWLTVESDYKSAGHIWDSLTRQLAKLRPDLGNQLNVLGFPADASQRDKIISIIEEHTYLNDIVLVLDDYHYARSQELDKLLERIVRTNIEGFHIIIISRTKPEINIEELSLKRYCFMIDSELFELSRDEIREFFKLYGCSVSDDSINTVHKISEGWITAVYLILQKYTATGRLESGRNIESLIETAIMSRYTEEESQILKSICILDSFTLQQAVYVTGNPAAAGIIERMSAGNSFLRYDEQLDVYKMHNIFSEYLKKQIEKQGSSIEAEALYKRSGQWYIRSGDILSGLSFLLKAKEYDLILTEFERHGATQELDKDPQLIVEVFSQIPDEVKHRHPMSYLTYAYNYISSVDMEGGAELLAQIEEHYRYDESIPDELRRRIAGEIELAGSFLYFNDLEKMNEKYLNAYSLLD